MRQITYKDIFMSRAEEDYLDSFDIDYNDAPINPDWLIVNQIIYYIFDEAIYNLDISDESKDKLRDAIRPNSIATVIDLSIDDLPDTEHDTIRSSIISSLL